MKNPPVPCGDGKEVGEAGQPAGNRIATIGDREILAVVSHCRRNHHLGKGLACAEADTPGGVRLPVSFCLSAVRENPECGDRQVCMGSAEGENQAGTVGGVTTEKPGAFIVDKYRFGR